MLLTTINSKSNKKINIQYEFERSIQDLCKSGVIDALIMSSEDGFSPLGSCREFVAKDLGIEASNISRLANWSRFENKDVSFISIPSQRKDSKLRGIILAPGETCECYKKFATPRYGKPYRDFYNNVSYECILEAAIKFNAKNIGMTHLSASNNFHRDIATCTMEALIHLANGNDKIEINSFIFTGCCISQSHLTGLEILQNEHGTQNHVPIKTQKGKIENFDLTTLNL